MHMRLILAGLAIVLTTVTCRPPTTTVVGISILLEANPRVAQTGDTVTFTVSVTGNNVSGVVIDFGDSSGDQYSAGGVATVQAIFRHAYPNVGNYMARATVSDAAVGNRVVTQLIVVSARNDSIPIGSARHTSAMLRGN